jgi:hypothetical protein
MYNRRRLMDLANAARHYEQLRLLIQDAAERQTRGRETE